MSNASLSSSDEAYFDTDDIDQFGCGVCALGTQRPPVPASSAVDIPAPGAPIPSMSGLLQDANDLEYEARIFRARLDMALALNAGLACHASPEGLHLENARLEDVDTGLEAQAARADKYETRYRVLKQATTEAAHDVQGELEVERARVADLSLRLTLATALPTVPTIAPERLRAVEGELVTTSAELSSIQAALSTA
ncbi:uncharacterized protein IUM83_12864 [Phytophthora cinnamomi]|uniref:uncharacterized protein n=1 Tax=Phytophthora cinnamomi TaxID=4785 RepID=UPI003559CC27|nr:hypothetical protein IUM83_12864 [Phytophthora cinnamomi]